MSRLAVGDSSVEKQLEIRVDVGWQLEIRVYVGWQLEIRDRTVERRFMGEPLGDT